MYVFGDVVHIYFYIICLSIDVESAVKNNVLGSHRVGVLETPTFKILYLLKEFYNILYICITIAFRQFSQKNVYS
jgi:hypothetical protein